MAVTAPTIAPLIARHAADAAFYWQQHDASVHSPLTKLTQLLEFDRLLEAHLDGLRVAGDAGWAAALTELERWTGAPEAFVATLLAAESTASGERLARVWRTVEQQPERMLRGFIGALVWTQTEDVMHWCAHWLHSGDSSIALKVAAWRILALQNIAPGQAPTTITACLPDALAHQDSAVRAASIRFAARQHHDRLLPLLQDPDPRVRAEAAIGLIQSAPSSLGASHQLLAANTLGTACHALQESLAALSGWPLSRAQHRLARWIKALAMAAPLEHPGVGRLLDLLPPRLGLWFMLFHGDPHYLPWVVQRMDDPQVARLAGWVWSMVTGVDLQVQGLTCPPRGPELESRPTDLHDPGLPEPDKARVQAMNFALPSHAPYLQGQPLLNEDHLRSMLWHAPQALRWIAAEKLRHMGHAVMSTRAPAWRQRQHLHSLVQVA